MLFEASDQYLSSNYTASLDLGLYPKQPPHCFTYLCSEGIYSPLISHGASHPVFQGERGITN